MNLMPFGISLTISLNASGQSFSSNPFCAKTVLAHLSSPMPEQPLHTSFPDCDLTLNPLGYLSPLILRFWNSSHSPSFPRYGRGASKSMVPTSLFPASPVRPSCAINQGVTHAILHS